MEQKILGIDLGTNSLGLAIRDIENGRNIVDQLDFYTSIIFQSGVGKDKSGEFSYAARRTKFRSSRRLYQARKYRIWATLRLLIANDCCPLTNEQLDKWAKYDKALGLKRQYPIDATEFEQWVRLDFNCDGQPEYSSPYQLRAELMNKPLDWNNQTDRFKFGRAMYHIAQRRGFKSSKGETLKESSENEDVNSIELGEAMKKSEEKKSKTLNEYMESNSLPTAGCAFAMLERQGIRVRGSEFQAVQSQLHSEVDQICKYQHIDQIAPDLYCRLISTKQGEGTIFFRRPLRSQKGLIGKCTLEPKLRRCPVSHPDYEEFRALSFINNIKFRARNTDDWQALNNDDRVSIFNELFTRAKATFKFEDIRKWIEKHYTLGELNYKEKTINYSDLTTVAGCPVISRLKKILGEKWNTTTITTSRTRINLNTGEIHPVDYNYVDIWHLAFSSDDYEELAEFSKKQMGFDEQQTGHLTRLWSAIQDGYASLSLKAIRNILPFLQQGMIYSEAVAFAKIPEILGKERWEKERDNIISSLREKTIENEYTKTVYNITNTLIANYNSRTLDEQQAYRNTGYIIDDIDRAEIMQCIIETLNERRWKALSDERRTALQKDTETLYQQFFASTKRDYYKLPRQTDAFRQCLSEMFPDIKSQQWLRLYHHSQIDLFPKQKPVPVTTDDGRIMQICQLGKPDIGSIKNPVVLRALYVLRQSINHLLKEGMIDEYTRVVVETARDLNDANWRKAIERYQKEREKENEAIANIIKEVRPNYTEDDIEKGRLLFEQIETKGGDNEDYNIVAKSTRKEKEKAKSFALDMQKYKLYKEQNFRCLYTGTIISLSDLFADNKVDIEHTIPRSISFDNSLSNRTVCMAHFNRKEKGNRIPTELSNYAEILTRIRPWLEHVEHIKTQIELWRGKARTAATIDRKNECIQQRHQWELELEYWQAKVRTFTIQKDELDIGFRNSQLVDTRIITKYAFHYLKSVFARVDVQKGSVTSDFRKILNVQSLDEKKDRSRHSHHAVDAAILTMIPVAAQRDRMIELFYKIDENPIDSERNTLQHKLEKEIAACNIGTVNGLIETIEYNILVNHVSKDQTLTPAKKPRRIGQRKIKGQWLTGDSIRGSLHKDTYYGAIKTTDETCVLVVRTPISSLNEKDLASIVDPAVRKAIEEQVRQRMAEQNISFTKAIEQPIYMLNRNGQPATLDCNGKALSPIRHVRCLAKAGLGYLKIDTALKIKQQTYKSKHSHKNTYYVQNDDNYLCLFYEGISKGKQRKEYRLINFFDIAQLKIHDASVLFNEPEFNCFEGSPLMPLKSILKKGCRVLLYNNAKEELYDLDHDTISQRLYVVYKFNAKGTPNLYLRHHLEARKESDCSIEEKGTAFDAHRPLSYLSLKASNFKAIVEHYDFEIDPVGNIIFI